MLRRPAGLFPWQRHPDAGSFFAPDLPRLELLPQGHAPTATPNTTKMAAGTAQTKGDLKEGDAAAKMAATRAKMAATRAKMAATRANMAAGSTGVTAAVSLADVNSANANMAAVDPNMAAVDPNMAAVDRDVAALDPNMAAVDPNMAALDPDVAAVDPNMAALDPTGDKMAAGRAASGEGRPLERKDGIKGPVGRGHPIAGPGWLLPFLLLPLL
ncbi:uncharacterized protein [Ciconia boyciana]|uniref:uncharacterized protein isoform X1 n=2 Tax=Ciconia boyciana TaxID=52775 RepID=UPI003B9E3385